MKKIIVSIICVLVLSTSIPINALDMAQEDELLETIVIENQSSMDYDRWAVIIGTYYLFHPVEPYPFPGLEACEAMDFYDNLTNADEKWDENNIKLLTDVNATKQDILDALDWLDARANEGDIVVFAFFGHGNKIDDEPPYDELDGKDEIIKPYDLVCDSSGNPLNDKYITDDVLSGKFDAIQDNEIKGMFIQISACLSGGLVSWFGSSSQSTAFQQTQERLDVGTGESNGYSTGISNIIDDEILELLGLTQEELIDLINDITNDLNDFAIGLSEDISVEGRVILTSSIPRAATLITEYSLGKGMRKAIEKGKTTAEDISFYAKWWVMSQPENYFLGIFLFFVGLNLPLSLLIVLSIQLIMLMRMGIIVSNTPIWKDGYPVDAPSSAKLPIIGDDDGSNNQNIQSQPSTPQSNPGSQQSTLRSSPSSTPTNR